MVIQGHQYRLGYLLHNYQNSCKTPVLPKKRGAKHTKDTHNHRLYEHTKNEGNSSTNKQIQLPNTREKVLTGKVADPEPSGAVSLSASRGAARPEQQQQQPRAL